MSFHPVQRGGPTYFIPIVLVKEYYWCPVQAFYKLVGWAERPTPSMLFSGVDGSVRARLVEALEGEGVRGEMYWEQPVASRRLGLAGRVDLLVDTGAGLVVVEAKAGPSARRVLGAPVRAQLAAYALAAEESFGAPVSAAYLYLVERGVLRRVGVGPVERGLVEHAAHALWEMLSTGAPPGAPRVPRGRCRACAYRGVCPHARA